MPDVPWEIGWNRKFEQQLEQLKTSGSYDNIRNTIEDIIENPVRSGRHKEGPLSGLRATHVQEKIICWEVTPNIRDPSLQDQVEELYFHFISHHDDMTQAVSRRNPAKTSTTEFVLKLPYMEGYVVEKKLNEIFSLCNEFEDFDIVEQEWEEEYVEVKGIITEESSEKVESVIPESADIDYDSSSLV